MRSCSLAQAQLCTFMRADRKDWGPRTFCIQEFRGRAMTGTNSFSNRIIGVLKLVPTTYREIADDKAATKQAAIVVVLATIAGAISGIRDGGEGVIGGLIGALISWIIFAFVGWFVGTKILGAPESPEGLGRLLRTTGFAQAPNLLLVLFFIPVLGVIAALVAFVWSLITGVLAVREGLQVSTGKAIVAAIVASILIGAAFFLIASVIGAGAYFGGFNSD